MEKHVARLPIQGNDLRNNNGRLGAASLSGTDQICVQCAFHSLVHGKIWYILSTCSYTGYSHRGGGSTPFQYFFYLKNFLATD
jgi:hypothetical protein